MCGKSKHLAEPVCIIPHDDITEKSYEEVKANARLIAAAPEMLAVLKACERIQRAYLLDLKDYPLINPEKGAAVLHLETIQAAIAKAEGT